MKKNGWMVFLLLFLSSLSGVAAAGPYPPAAGQPGSTAIYMDDPSLVAWATGYENYTVGLDVDNEWQTPEKALGKAAGTSNDIVCLGRGGRITMTFDRPIRDGAGWDFAVFENSISDTFLELAYVEVSDDGQTWHRFVNRSLTPDPVPAFGTVDPTNVDGLGGKYRQGYGTPFDLADVGLKTATHVMIIDIVGNGLWPYLDSTGHAIYDPYPTTGSAGFDLDAIGVIHRSAAVPPFLKLLLLDH